MSRATERLIDLLFNGPAWQSWPAMTTMTFKKINATEEMLIEPDTEHGPMLRVQTKNENGEVVHARTFNLPALDEHIGKLIEMRDALARLKGE